MMAKFYHGSRLIGEGSGGGAGAAPQSRDPLVHTSRRKGAKYDKKKSKGKDADGEAGGDSDKEGGKTGKRKLTPLERCEKKISKLLLPLL